MNKGEWERPRKIEELHDHATATAVTCTGVVDCDCDGDGGAVGVSDSLLNIYRRNRISRTSCGNTLGCYAP